MESSRESKEESGYEPFFVGSISRRPSRAVIRMVWGLAQAAVALTQAAWAGAAEPRATAVAARPELNLDGVWEFATDPDRVGEQEQWFRPQATWPAMPRPGYAPDANGTIRVPGIWDNQGYGTETPKVRHNFVGLGWYRRTVTVPSEWAGRRVFLCIGGVHRYAKVVGQRRISWASTSATCRSSSLM